MTALHTLGVADIVNLVRRRDASPVDIVSACLARR
jgi:hypothetical protein